MQAAAHNEAPADGLTLGARASLELQLQDARRDLHELNERRGALLRQADVARALACESGPRSTKHNIRAAGLRLDAFLMDPDVAAAKLKVANLESQLKSAPAQVAPVVFKAGQVEGQDDTMNFLGAAA